MTAASFMQGTDACIGYENGTSGDPDDGSLNPRTFSYNGRSWTVKYVCQVSGGTLFLGVNGDATMLVDSSLNFHFGATKFSSLTDADNTVGINFTIPNSGLILTTGTTYTLKFTSNQVPPAPRLSAQGGSRRIDLSWSGKTGGSDITGSRIEVSTDGTDGTWTDLVESTTDTTYSHTGLAASTRRYYRVSATNALGTGPTSGVVWATPVAQPVDVPADGGVFGKVVWTATLTTAAVTLGMDDFTGFSDLSSEGSLDPDEFVIPAGIEYGGVEYGGLTFGFDLIGWRDGDDTVRPNTLYMALKIGGSPCGVQHHPATAFPDWALHVGGKKLWFADLLTPSSGMGFCLATFYWDNVDLPWTGGETVEVKITSGETGAYPELLSVQDAEVDESGDGTTRDMDVHGERGSGAGF